MENSSDFISSGSSSMDGRKNETSSNNGFPDGLSNKSKAKEGEEKEEQQAADNATHLSSAIKGETNSSNSWHARKISWGVDTFLGEPPAAATAAMSPKSPKVAMAAEPATTTVPSGNTSEAAAAGGTTDEDAQVTTYLQHLFAGAPGQRIRQKRISSLGTIDLADILKESPIETEAETYILRAIEEREQQARNEAQAYSSTNNSNTHNRGVSTASSILSQVPDDAISNLTRSSDTDEEDRNEDHENEEGHSQGKDTTTSPGGASSASSRRLLLSQQKQQQSVRNTMRRYHHTRNLTMEQQLCGLASAIDALHHDTEQDGGFMPTLDEYTPKKSSSAETLQHNASQLFHRGIHKGKSFRNLFAKKEVEVEPSPQPPIIAEEEDEPPWASSSVPSDDGNLHPKKTDGDPSSTRSAAEAGGGDSILMDQNSVASSSSKYPQASVTGDIEQGGGSQDDNNNPDHNKSSVSSASMLPPSLKDKVPPSTAPTSNKKKRREWHQVRELQDFFAPQKTTIALYFRVVFCYIATPLVAIAALLFYAADCPPTGRLAYGGQTVNGTLWNQHGDAVDPTQASVAWWLMFVVRCLVTFTLAKCCEKVFVDYFTIRSRGTIQVFGPWLTLFILQSRGWPATVTFWSLFNFGLLYGTSDFVHHWLYWQNAVGLFTAENPAGTVVDSVWNLRILCIALVLALAVALKRLFLGLYLGKRTFQGFADQLAVVMKNILMITEVAVLAKDFEREHLKREMRIRAYQQRGHTAASAAAAAYSMGMSHKLFDTLDDLELDEDTASQTGGMSTADRSENKGRNVTQIIDPQDRNPWTGLLTYTQQQRIIQLLGAWEEPVIAEKKVENISVSALLQFRRSMACLNTPFYFSASFGVSDTREKCIQSAQELYWRLLLNDPSQSHLTFETLALLGLKSDGTLDQAKLKDLIRLFRPERDGSLSLVDFVKSIDAVYKEIRMLRASGKYSAGNMKLSPLLLFFYDS
jgi:hypothetical protein